MFPVCSFCDIYLIRCIAILFNSLSWCIAILFPDVLGQGQCFARELNFLKEDDKDVTLSCIFYLLLSIFINLQLAGSVTAVFNCQGPLDAPIFVGSGMVSRKIGHAVSNFPISSAYEAMMKNKEAGAMAAFDRVPLSYLSANFTFNTDNCVSLFYVTNHDHVENQWGTQRFSPTSQTLIFFHFYYMGFNLHVVGCWFIWN